MKDKKNLNELVDSSKRLVRLLYVIFIILGIYIGILVFNALKIGEILIVLLQILLPLFIGILIAWLFKPIVSKLESKGLRRGLACALVYIVFVGVIVWILFTLIPLLYNQINDLIVQLPAIGNDAQEWLSRIFEKISNIPGIDVEGIKITMTDKLQQFGNEITTSIPETAVKIVSSIASGAGTFGLGLIIGFFALVSIDHPLEAIRDFLPKKSHKTFEGIMASINGAARSFISGAAIDCTLVFVVSSIAFWAVGLKAPLLFGLFCGLTNVIPYAGPYIGGAPALIVGFSQGPVTGFLVLAMLVIIQSLEGSFIQTLIMSKSTKLHPITIIMGLLIFGHFWGIIGMFISTPVIASLKAVIVYLDERFDILSFK